MALFCFLEILGFPPNNMRNLNVFICTLYFLCYLIIKFGSRVTDLQGYGLALVARLTD